LFMTTALLPPDYAHFLAVFVANEVLRHPTD
jgi:hypothetical protein